MTQPTNEINSTVRVPWEFPLPFFGERVETPHGSGVVVTVGGMDGKMFAEVRLDEPERDEAVAPVPAESAGLYLRDGVGINLSGTRYFDGEYTAVANGRYRAILDVVSAARAWRELSGGFGFHEQAITALIAAVDALPPQAPPEPARDAADAISRSRQREAGLDMDRIEQVRMAQGTYWSCACGAGGSAASDRVDIAAEKHVRDGESVVYRTRKVDW